MPMAADAACADERCIIICRAALPLPRFATPPARCLLLTLAVAAARCLPFLRMPLLASVFADFAIRLSPISPMPPPFISPFSPPPPPRRADYYRRLPPPAADASFRRPPILRLPHFHFIFG